MMHGHKLYCTVMYIAPSEVSSVLIDVISNESIDVLWDPPTRPNGILTYYSVIVFNEMTGFNFSMTVPASEYTEITVTGLRKKNITSGAYVTVYILLLQHAESFVPYTIQVYASTAAGRGRAVSTMAFTGHGGDLITPVVFIIQFCMYACIYTVPAIPSLSSVERLSAVSARVNWIPLTPDEARGILTLLEIAYEPIRVRDCTDFYPRDAELMEMRENLFDQSTAIINGLQPNQEYCVSIKVATSGGESGYSSSLLIPGSYIMHVNFIS